MFSTLVFTAPEFIPCETTHIETLLKSGAADFVHIRKPGASAAKISRLIESIDSELQYRLVLHDNFELALRGLAGGVHLNNRSASAPFGIPCSASMHDAEVAASLYGLRYLTLSPVYDSISKTGYKSKAFNRESITRIPTRTIALGGLTPSKFADAASLGFKGAALLGYVWKNPCKLTIREIVNNIIAAKYHASHNIDS